ncbi:ribonucleoside-diphosphate reductase subunit alpha [Burkholderia cepacia]|uniref:ribonucleoside-diphosphate reductase subunit alpha n=1 Tax=Burkholderia cepacia TaxID=292 RepID=UPI0015771FBE|nr:ribonucleoside-diphosphate reductase subunit alpha [Burkholderia cepacia]
MQEVVKRDGSREPLQIEKIQKATAWACAGLNVSQSELETSIGQMFFDGISTAEIHRATILAAAGLISTQAPDYAFVAARLLKQQIFKESVNSIDYPHLASYLAAAVYAQKLTPELVDGRFDLEALDAAIRPSRDDLFDYLGLQTLADRYFIRETPDGRILEMPQHFWMRVAMGLALREDDPTERAIEFYTVLSQFYFVSSTPTLFNSATLHQQMSSCYGNKVGDSIVADEGEHEFNSIYGAITECALLSKYAGGIGTDWTPVRSAGSHIKGTNGKSSGVVPYLKVYNDTAVAVNQGGKRKGSFAPYLETWHPDLPKFLLLRKNTGDEHERAHDIFPANWIPDLFMERVEARGMWRFFDPSQHPELHELHGDAFKARYEELEAAGAYVGEVEAIKLWRDMLTALFETGNPWMTWKDECNRRNPQSHVGVVHNSNLCTEIVLNNSEDETFVCNLGSVNVGRVNPFSHPSLFRLVVKTGMRMLDNVIDINFYPSDRAKTANMRHRPVGLGLMGLSDLMAQNGIDWESNDCLDLNDELLERLSYEAISASCDLAVERGAYSTFEGSKWSQGILPIHTARDQSMTMPGKWVELRNRVMSYGMRNSNTMAIAPTATISNIVGASPCIEPNFERFSSKKNMGGKFLVIAPSLRYAKTIKTAFEIDPTWIVKAAARRQKWIDQAQSTNIWIKAGTKGKDLSALYMLAWKLGLKTTYYLRTQSAEQAKEVEAPAGAPAEAPAQDMMEAEVGAGLCSVTNPDCTSCQ